MSSSFPAIAAPPAGRLPFQATGGEASRPETRFRTAFAAVVVAAAYYAGAKLGFAFTFQSHPISVLWLPNALLLAGLLLLPTRTWWVVLLAVLPAHLAAELQSGVPRLMVVAWYFTNCAEAVIGAGAIRFLLRSPLQFDSLRHTTIFLVCAVGLAPTASTFLDVGLVKAIGWGQGGFMELARMRLLSNSLASLILVPVIITWARDGLQALRDASMTRRMEAIALFTGLMAVGWLAFETGGNDLNSMPAILYAPLPFLLWAAVRLGSRSVSLCLLVTLVLATWGAVHGQGPFVGGTPEQNALSVQLFVLAVAIPFLLFSAVMDEHRLDRRAVEQSEQRALAVFRAGPDAMAIVRLRDRVLLDVNDRWEEFFGYTRAEAVGRNSAELRMYLREEQRDTFFDLARRDGCRNMEADMRHRSGEIRHALLSSERVTVGSESECLVAVIRDITPQRAAEREAQQQRIELTHLSRVAVLGELSGALAHELNQPLTAILSNAQTAQRLLAREQVDMRELREILADIASEDKRAGEVIRRLRAMFKKGDPQFQRLNANDLLKDALTLAGGNLATRHIRVTTRLCSHDLSVKGDRVQLQQVLLNLILNATEAMETPGSTRLLELETAPQPDGGIQILVRDGGPGVPEAVMARLFDPFFTTKSQGLGLGLSISRSIVQTHGGQLLARNNPDRGATFRVILPGHA